MNSDISNTVEFKRFKVQTSHMFCFPMYTDTDFRYIFRYFSAGTTIIQHSGYSIQYVLRNVEFNNHKPLAWRGNSEFEATNGEPFLRQFSPLQGKNLPNIAMVLL